VVFLSKYLPESAALYRMSADEALAFSIPHLQRMFPAFSADWVKGRHLWRARYAQPVVGPNYSRLIPGPDTPLSNVRIASMAQIYPEDRGTNYAVREGRRAGREMAEARRAPA
jgi:protoporphyrinogen oxidase